MRSGISPNPSPFRAPAVLLAAAVLLSACPPARAYDLGTDRKISPRRPVEINAAQLRFDRLKGLTLFTGHVKAVHDRLILWADQIRALEVNQEATAEGHVRVVDRGAGLTLTCGNLEYQNRMNLMTAHDHPRLTARDEKGRPVTILGRQMVLDSEKKTVQINQNVRILHPDGRAQAQKALFLAGEDKVILEEDPVVTTGEGVLSGRRITTNLGEDRSLFVEGMADAVFDPQADSTSPVPGTPGKGRPGADATPVAKPGPFGHNGPRPMPGPPQGPR